MGLQGAGSAVGWWWGTPAVGKTSKGAAASVAMCSCFAPDGPSSRLAMGACLHRLEVPN